jgi:uncharacterized protein YkwD
MRQASSLFIAGWLVGCAEVDADALTMADEQSPPPPVLTATDATPGHDVIYTVSGVSPGGTARLMWGAARGAGPCPPVLNGLCFNIVGATVFGDAVADASGRAVWRLPIALTAPFGAGAWFQAAAMTGQGVQLTSALRSEVVRPEDVCDASGDGVVSPQEAAFECELLALVNALRYVGADCGSNGVFGPTHPYTMDPALREASRVHADWMADGLRFSHASPGGPLGDTFVERAENAGYGPWRRLSETIARGGSTPQRVLDIWMDSDDHCADMLSPGKRDIGFGLDVAANGVTYASSTQGSPR